MSKVIHLGYEVGSGDAVEIPVRHMAVTGQTQESGKTSTLEALIARSGLTALAFVTKRGETAFAEGRRVRPYFRDRADWQFVDQLLEAQLREKNKFLRSWIIKICRHTKTLADVQRAVRTELVTAKGMNHGVYTQLDAYLELIVPEIQQMALASELVLHPGLNVMDVSGLSTPMQMLLVQSAIDWVNEHERDTIVVVPEAWEFIPEGKGSPVKLAAVSLVRKGAALGNYIWVDSQDMAGVDKVILRGCAVWLIGVQREANEIKRNLANIPANITRPKPGDVATIERGQFFACHAKRAIRTYVQPAWMSQEDAHLVAIGFADPTDRPAPNVKEATVKESEARALRDENARLNQDYKRLVSDHEQLGRDNLELRRRLEALEQNHAPSSNGKAAADGPRSGHPRREMPEAPTPAGAAVSLEQSFDNERLYQAFKQRLINEAPGLLKIIVQKPELRVEIERPVIDASADTAPGRVAMLIADGFLDEPKIGYQLFTELKRLGFAVGKSTVYSAADSLAAKGFLTKEGDGYRAVPGMKVNIVER